MTRINQFIAKLSGISRRSADKLVESGKILVNGEPAKSGYRVSNTDKVKSLDPKFKFNYLGNTAAPRILLMLNKPAGYVSSRSGQGSKTVYDLLPEKYHCLKTIGRLDKDSSGLLLLTNDGELANELTHPKYQKEKLYKVKLNKPLRPADKNKLKSGIKLDDGPSKFINIKNYPDGELEVKVAEGRNRQIRRTFEALGYKVTNLHRIKFGDYVLKNQKTGVWQQL
jgi:23S rRNA pseudouridine2605 synthase